MVESAIDELCEDLDRGIARHVVIGDRDRSTVKNCRSLWGMATIREFYSHIPL